MGLSFRPFNIHLTNKVLPSGVVQQKFLLNGKTCRIHLLKLAFPLSIPLWFKLLKPKDVYFFLSQILVKLHFLLLYSLSDSSTRPSTEGG